MRLICDTVNRGLNVCTIPPISVRRNERRTLLRWQKLAHLSLNESLGGDTRVLLAKGLTSVAQPRQHAVRVDMHALLVWVGMPAQVHKTRRKDKQ